jgi:ribonuclease R
MELSARILKYLAAPAYHPLSRSELARKLNVPPHERVAFRKVLAQLIQNGEVVRVRKNRFVLPQEADLVIGKIEMTERGFGFVTPDPPRPDSEDIYVAAEDTWVAMHGDKVVVRLNREPVAAKRPGEKRLSGRVIRILERANATVVGTLQQTRHFFYVVPEDPRIIHDIYVKPESAPTATKPRVGDKVVVRLAEWKHRHVNPEGDIIEVLGHSTDPGVDVLAIIRKHKLATTFPPNVLAEAAKLPDEIPAHEIARRRDFRHHRILTIDPDDAKDFDDAVEVERLPNGGWRLGVHIADPSYYVRPNTALDREAFTRGNSTYLVDRVIPMLPEKLSNFLCSLRPNEDKLTKSVIIEFTDKGVVKHVEFANSVIRSFRRLDYKQVYRALTDQLLPEDEITPDLADYLKLMWELASLLRRKRFQHGSLDLNFPEVKVRVDKHGKPLAIEKVVHDISHQLIEEFMLAANEAVARHLRRLQVPCLYRVHEDPSEENLREFAEYAATYGYRLGDVSNRKVLQRLLESVKDKPEAYPINLKLLRSLKRARYDEKPLGHYGLAKQDYTHFTSPIRRYADFIVHRILDRQLPKGSASVPLAKSGMGEWESGRTAKSHSRPFAHSPIHSSTPFYDSAALATIAAHISHTERVAQEAEQESVEIKRLEYFQTQLMTGKLDAFDAVVSNVRNFGLFVELPESLVQGLIHISTLDDDFYYYDEARNQLTGKRTKKTWRIGDKCRVTVARVDVFKRQVDFQMVTEQLRKKK